jgi:hypothetical protein
MCAPDTHLAAKSTMALMKRILLFSTLILLFSSAARANPVAMSPIRAVLIGETVSVRILADRAAVTAVYQFSAGDSRVRKRVFFPLFAAKGQDPISVLAGSSLNEKIAGIAEPCEPPVTFSDMPADADVYWFAADLDPLVAEAEPDGEGPFVLRATFVQPLVHGRFYYIPLIRGLQQVRDLARAWNYQLLARAQSRMPMVSSKSDYEPLDDAVVV